MKRSIVIWVLLGALGCTAKTAVLPPPGVHRIAVLPPYGPLYGADRTAPSAAVDALRPPRLTVSDVLAAQARLLLAEKGFAVVDPTSLEIATKGRVPTSPQVAAQMVAEAQLDATAMFIAVRVWQSSSEGMRTDSIIVALDVMLVDPQTAQVVWQVHRSPKPVPLYGTLLTGQADVFAAETVMREVLASLGAPPAA